MNTVSKTRLRILQAYFSDSKKMEDKGDYRSSF